MFASTLLAVGTTLFVVAVGTAGHYDILGIETVHEAVGNFFAGSLS